jgi:ABC-type Fe3+ transport system permease subunit
MTYRATICTAPPSSLPSEILARVFHFIQTRLAHKCSLPMDELPKLRNRTHFAREKKEEIHMKTMFLAAGVALAATVVGVVGLTPAYAVMSYEQLQKRCESRGLMAGQVRFCINRDMAAQRLKEQLNGQQQKKQ